MIGFIGTAITITLNYNHITAHNRWLSKTRSIPSWTTSVFSSTVADFSDDCLRLTNCSPESESYIASDGQSASPSWNKAPVWGFRPDFYYCQTVSGLLMWGAVFDERTGLSFTIAAGPLQSSHFRVLVPWDSGSYFTVSGSRLLFSSPPTTPRATVEVFEPASAWDWPLL
jgi:hypothetical protein